MWLLPILCFGENLVNACTAVYGRDKRKKKHFTHLSRNVLLLYYYSRYFESFSPRLGGAKAPAIIGDLRGHHHTKR